MNVYRSALSACVVPDLPNIQVYIHQNRHMLMEEKRQKLLAMQQQADAPAMQENTQAVQNISQVISHILISQTITDLFQIPDFLHNTQCIKPQLFK